MQASILLRESLRIINVTFSWHLRWGIVEESKQWAGREEETSQCEERMTGWRTWYQDETLQLSLDITSASWRCVLLLAHENTGTNQSSNHTLIHTNLYYCLCQTLSNLTVQTTLWNCGDHTKCPHLPKMSSLTWNACANPHYLVCTRTHTLIHTKNRPSFSVDKLFFCC